MDITPYLKLMIEKDASDIFFTVDAPVKIKLDGRVTSVGKTRLTGDLVKQAAYGIMTKEQVADFEKNLEADFAIALADGSARFRVNVFRQRGEVAMVLRLIPARVPTLDGLGLPKILKSLVLKKRGLTLMAGATGSGKSTTLAAMIDHRNEQLPGHILTIEDPIEFYHPNRKSIVNQREVGIDTLSYGHALRSALREAPDVILIGEIRDRESMEAALQLANTGHLAIATIHANNASEALDRIVNLFPEELHKQLFMDLAITLKAIISQRLVQDVRGKRCAAIEVLINTPHIAELILKCELGAIKEAMAGSSVEGMQTFDVALFNLYREGRVTLEEALNNADSRTNLEAKVNFG